jgi:hypothetical protein
MSYRTGRTSINYAGSVTNSRPGAPEKTLDQAEQQRLNEIRARGGEAMRTALTGLVAQGPDDTLGALAWLAGSLGSGVDNPVAAEALSPAITRARTERFSWREIADALGEGDTIEDSRRVRERHRRWSR